MPATAPPPVLPPKPALAVRLLNNRPLLRMVLPPLVRLRPVLGIGSRVLLSRHADVLDVLARDEDFTVAEGNAATMDRVNGPFILGMDRSEQCLRERAILERCVTVADADRIRSFVRSTAAGLIDERRPTGRVDVVSDLARVVAVRLVADFFGVAGPDEATLKRWMRTIFHETFLNVGSDPRVRRAGEASAAELHLFVDDLIVRRQDELRRGDGVPDDLVTRLVRLQADPETRLSDEGVRRNIGGVIVGAVDTTSKATAHAVDELLRRPEALTTARAAAAAGDMDGVCRHALEALRFNPINPVLARHVARSTTVATGTKQERPVPAGSKVYPVIMAAMFDPAVFDDPQRFRADRPIADYLHFGAGMHGCFGRQINLIQIPEVVAALVALPNLRRDPGPEGTMAYDGPFPDRLVARFDAPFEATASSA